MKIEIYLSQLLYTHECVVVPEFGGFLTRQFPAQINQATHMFVPPSKRISFNQQLRNNDGLLTMHVAKRNNISYQEAQLAVMAAVTQWHQTLKQGNQLQLQDIGRFYYSSEGALQFKAVVDVNFSTDTFGMGVFRATPIVQHNRLVNMNQTNAAVDATKPSTRKPKRRRDWLRSAAVLIPISGLLFLAVIKTDFDKQITQSAAALFSPRAVVPELTVTPSIQKFEAAEIELNRKASAETQVLEEPQTTPAPELPTPVNVEVETAPLAIDAAGKPFQVIAGSFSTLFNANKLAQSFPSQAFTIDPGHGKLIKVSLGGFDTREEAAAFIASNKDALPVGTWVFKQ
jgi:hypothetical protein